MTYEEKIKARYYWCVKVPRTISLDGEIYAWADFVRIEYGTLVLVRSAEDVKTATPQSPEAYVAMSFAPGSWFCCYAASVWDGHAFMAEYWAGEVEPNGRDWTSDEWERYRERIRELSEEVYGTAGKTRPNVKSIAKPKNGPTARLRYRIKERDGFKCVACGRSAKDGAILHVDHKMPLAAGGTNHADNLQTLCNECNHGKSDSIP